MSHAFLSQWRAFKPSSTVNILEADVDGIRNLRSNCVTAPEYGWTQFIQDPQHGAEKDGRLHLSLTPIPFLGNIETAKVVVLLLNPGLGATDYYGEFRVPGFKDKLLANLRGDLSKHDYPFMFLDPAISWHGGFKWWNDKLRSVIFKIAEQKGTDYATARQLLSRHLGAIELVPYHSEKFLLTEKQLDQLSSVDLARSYVHGPLSLRARSGLTRIVVTRKADVWGLKSAPPFIDVYDSKLARSGSLSIQSSGGNSIFQALADVEA